MYLSTGSKNFNLLLGSENGIEVDTSGINSILIQGETGVGKTTLALQLVITSIKENKNPSSCLYFTFDQPAELLDQMIDLFWDIESKIIKYEEDAQKQIVIDFQNQPLSDFNIIGGFENSENQVSRVDILRIVSEFYQYSREKHLFIVLDSINSIENLLDFERSQIRSFKYFIKQLKCTILFLRERNVETESTQSDYIADYVINLHKDNKLYISKTRLHKGYYGPHEYEIIRKKSGKNKTDTEKIERYVNGINVYPNLFDFDKIVAKIESEQLCDKRARFNITPDYDNLYKKYLKDQKSQKNEQINLEDQNYNDFISKFYIAKFDEEFETDKNIRLDERGLKYGSSLLIKGDPGCFKTELAIKFLNEGYIENEGIMFVSFRMANKALKDVVNNEEINTGLFEKLKFVDLRNPFLTASQCLSRISNLVEFCNFNNNERTINRAVVFGIGMLNNYSFVKEQLIEFVQTLILYFVKKNIACLFVDWFKSKEELETLASEHAQNFIPNQINIESSKVNPDFKRVSLERRETRFKQHYYGCLKLNKDKKILTFIKCSCHENKDENKLSYCTFKKDNSPTSCEYFPEQKVTTSKYNIKIEKDTIEKLKSGSEVNVYINEINAID